MTPKALIAAAIFLVVGAALTVVAYLTRQDTSAAPAAAAPAMPGLTAVDTSGPGADPFAPASAPPEGPASPGSPSADRSTAPPPPFDPGRRTPAARPPETSAAPEAPAPRPPARAGGLAVLEATLCKDVDRETRKPVGASDAFRARDGRIWCFMKLSGGANRKVRTVWHLGERTHPGIWLKAGAYGAETWRTWAYKNIDETMAGAGRVEIVDEKGLVLHTMPVRIAP